MDSNVDAFTADHAASSAQAEPPGSALRDQEMITSIPAAEQSILAAQTPAASPPAVGYTVHFASGPAGLGEEVTLHTVIPSLSPQTEALLAQVKAQSQSNESTPSTPPPPSATAPLSVNQNEATPAATTEAPHLTAPAEAVRSQSGGRRRGPRRRITPPRERGLAGSDPSASHPAHPSISQPRGTSRGGARGRGRGGSGGGRGGSRRRSGLGKRKRSTDEDDGDEVSDGSNGGSKSGFTSSSEEVTLLPAISRSGRKITQTAQPTPTITLEPPSTPAAAMPEPAGHASSFKRLRAAGAAGKKARRTPGASAVCRNCGRGHSPASNPIAFCDGCNAAWHRFCHDPPIRADALASVERDWFCADCVLLREHSAVLEGKVAGDHMSVAEKRKYLKTLSPNTLVTLLLHATALHPSLPIYPPKPQLITINPQAPEQPDDGLYEIIDDELPYPRAGNGVPLPPESSFLDVLVDDDASVYSHRWTGIAEMMAAAGWPAKSGTGVRTGNAGLAVKAGA